jgi:glyceraldehyde-3-phosphate dehydrogenase/erythrose-4-phosphate dehydrogenase
MEIGGIQPQSAFVEFRRVGFGPIKVLAERDPSNLPWADLNVDVVMKCTGALSDREKGAIHLVAVSELFNILKNMGFLTGRFFWLAAYTDAALSMMPAPTGAANVVGLYIRVPVPNGSVIDLRSGINLTY